MHESALKARTVQLAALLLLALGQLTAAVHAFEHGIADQPERCATCVHLDQGSAAATNPGTPIPCDPSSDLDTTCTASDPLLGPAGSFDARAPPL
jgi:hypothetical protein